MNRIGPLERATQERGIAQIGDEEHCGCSARKVQLIYRQADEDPQLFQLTHFLFANSVSA